jgi:hypothetical protein
MPRNHAALGSLPVAAEKTVDADGRLPEPGPARYVLDGRLHTQRTRWATPASGPRIARDYGRSSSLQKSRTLAAGHALRRGSDREALHGISVVPGVVHVVVHGIDGDSVSPRRIEERRLADPRV